MNVFTNLLFLQGHLTDPHLLDEEHDRYAKGYGNRVASERFFAPFGHGKAEARSDSAPSPYPNSDCAVGACG